MHDVIAPKQPSLIPGPFEAMTFLKINMSLIPNDQADVPKTLIWNTLIPSCPELSDDIGGSDDNENEKDDDDDDDDEEEEEEEEPILVEEANYTC
jgi:hypothetical protein